MLLLYFLTFRDQRSVHMNLPCISFYFAQTKCIKMEMKLLAYIFFNFLLCRKADTVAAKWM